MKQDDKVYKSLKIARGQVEGIIKMLEDGRYCIDVSKQIMATISILKNVNAEILHNHMKGCVMEAIHKGEGEKSLDELLEIMKKYL